MPLLIIIYIAGKKSQNIAIFSLFTHFGVVSIKKQIVFFRDGDFMWFCVVSKNRTFLHLSDYYASWDAVPYDGTYEWILSIHRSFVWVKKITILSKLSTTTNPIDSRIYHEKKKLILISSRFLKVPQETFWENLLKKNCRTAPLSPATT